jgi:DnaJ-class molecular chaperone
MSTFNDRLDDIFSEHVAEPKTLPQDAASVRIRAEFTEKCPRCHGTGRFVGYTGRTLGDCFICSGTGYRSFKTAPKARQRGF